MLELLDLIAVVGSLLSLLAYHIYSYVTVFCCESRSIQLTRNMLNGLIWVAKHKAKSDPASVTLAVQTLRNTMLVAIFIGGSSLQFGVSYLNSYGSDSRTYMHVRAVILAAFLMCSFLCWASVIRGASHLGYLIGSPVGVEREQLLRQQQDLDAAAVASPFVKNSAVVVPSIINPDGTTPTKDDHATTNPTAAAAEEEVPQPDTLAESQAMIKLMMISFSMGFRFLFISIPFWFYAAGPIALIVSSICLLAFLYNLDHLEIKRRGVGLRTAFSALDFRLPSPRTPIATLRSAVAASRGYQDVSTSNV